MLSDIPRLQFGASPFDRRGYLRSPVTLPDYRLGQRPPNAGKRLPPEVLEPGEIFRLIAACGHNEAGRRNRALLVMLWRAGLRCAEALDLMPKDVDLDRGRVQVLHGKGNKRRIVAIDPAAAAIIRRWALERDELGLTGRDHFYCVINPPTRGARLGDAYVRELCKQLAARAGIEKRVHPHGFRHTYASWLADRGVPVHHIQQMLGHSSLSVTQRYISHLNPAQVVEAMRAVEWPATDERSL